MNVFVQWFAKWRADDDYTKSFQLYDTLTVLTGQ